MHKVFFLWKWKKRLGRRPEHSEFLCKVRKLCVYTYANSCIKQNNNNNTKRTKLIKNKNLRDELCLMDARLRKRWREYGQILALKRTTDGHKICHQHSLEMDSPFWPSPAVDDVIVNNRKSFLQFRYKCFYDYGFYEMQRSVNSFS